MKFLSRLAAGVGITALAAATLTLGPTAATAASTRLQTKAKTDTPAFPAVTVTDIKTGKPFKLASLSSGKKPTLVWFWAPL